MRVSSLLATLAAAGTALSSAIELPAGVPRNIQEFREKHPYEKRGKDCHRKTYTIRASKNDLDDISDEFVEGLKKANNGGTLYLPANQTFIIGKPLDLTWLNDVHVHWEGEIKFTNDTPYWQENAFTHPFQNSIMFWKWGGNKVKLYGEGVLNGNGQRWWNEFAGLEILDPDNTYLRPILFYAENATGLSMEGLHLKDSPCWTTFVVTSKDISFKDVIVTAESNNATALPKNTDFFDSLNVEDVRVERTWVNIGDDCFSPKSNATNIHVDTMYCNGTHGQSMGSLGQYAGEKSFVKDVVIENVWMLNGQHGARLKTWAGPNVGYGFIDNVTFRNFWQANNEYTAFIDSCYFNINASVCEQYPSQMNISNILFENFSGYSSGKTSTSPHPVAAICDGIKGGIGMPCIPSNSTEAKEALAAKCTTALAEATPWVVRPYDA
uniref:galacturonan 1,4-alpha-galacturonidase n=1 Tax=Colletotrichum fructicola (strain Nara gc5) TaxID=1213859 RepID=L2GH13_COLFN